MRWNGPYQEILIPETESMMAYKRKRVDQQESHQKKRWQEEYINGSFFLFPPLLISPFFAS